MCGRSLVLIALAACGPVKGTPPTDAPANTNTDGFKVAVLSANVAVPLDGKATVDLAITRMGDFTGDVSIVGVTPPNGLEITDLVVPADATTAQLVVGALSPLVIGDTVDFDLAATGTDVDPQTTAITDAEVTGKPGSLDVSFGVGTGYAGVIFGNDDGGSFNTLEVLGGKVIATGEGQGALSGPRFSTMRFTAAGEQDATFNAGTRLVTVFNSGSTNETTRSGAIAHQLDGRPILIGTHEGKSPTQDLAIARLSNTGGAGGVDFGNQTGAKSLIDLSTAAETVNDGVVLPDDRIVFVGEVGGHHMIAVATSGGLLDTSFNTTGFIKDVLGNGSTARRAIVDGDGKAVVLGTTQGAADVDLTLHRYSGTGLDTTFGLGGRLIVAAPGTDEGAINLAVLSTGKVIVGSVSGTNFQIRKFNADGSADTTFGTNGLVEAPANGTARDLAVLPDGKIVILAQSGNDSVLLRFLANGTADPLFGTDGVVSIPCGDSATINKFRVYDAHKIVIAGGNEGGVPGPGTKGLLVRVWM